MKKNFMKKGLIAVLFSVVAAIMFSGCELLLLLGVAGALADYNKVYIKNDTPTEINLYYDQDPSSLYEGETRQVGYAVIKPGKEEKNAFTAGNFKLSIGNQIVLPEGASNPDKYYSIYANSLVTIKFNNGSYYYTTETRE